MEELNYFEEGWEHIISRGALDHQLFILALAALYTLKHWKQVLILVTAFTIGHSVTLALSAFRIVNINADLVETLIPITIAVTALTNFSQRSEMVRYMQPNYGLALFFGFIHGLGFANFIRFTLAEGQQVAWPLLQFNLGLEAGQIVFVVTILCVASLFVHIIGLNRRWWTWVVSAVVFLLALKMIIERFST